MSFLFIIDNGPLRAIDNGPPLLCCWPSGMYWLTQSCAEPTRSLDAGFSTMAVFAAAASPVDC
jgi:hypothetical protein